MYVYYYLAERSYVHSLSIEPQKVQLMFFIYEQTLFTNIIFNTMVVLFIWCIICFRAAKFITFTNSVTCSPIFGHQTVHVVNTNWGKAGLPLYFLKTPRGDVPALLVSQQTRGHPSTLRGPTFLFVWEWAMVFYWLHSFIILLFLF